jgi:ornithine cyclodeaminase/alanine dehydrogenase-like protein (mu-crystallin family)
LSGRQTKNVSIARQGIAGEIGEVISGKKQGGRSDDEITCLTRLG